jgi:acyl-CoA dehydrogenase
MFVDAYARLTAMKLFTLRAADYQRSASLTDRRYLLYNPMVKMKVTTQGEEVINLLWDVIAAKGFEKDTYFEMAARDIRALPKLEGTVHVNIALIVKFLPITLTLRFILSHAAPIRKMILSCGIKVQRGLGEICFHDLPGVHRLRPAECKPLEDQTSVLQESLATATPDEAQQKDVDFLLALGELFALVVYAQLILENVQIYKGDVNDDLVDQIFNCLVRDFSMHALQLYSKPSSSARQMELCQRMIRKPVVDPGRFDRVWGQVHALKDTYELK